MFHTINTDPDFDYATSQDEPHPCMKGVYKALEELWLMYQKYSRYDYEPKYELDLHRMPKFTSMYCYLMCYKRVFMKEEEDMNRDNPIWVTRRLFSTFRNADVMPIICGTSMLND
jgi:hypothetical protein